MEQHLTVKEAGELVGKSESTIKRLIREITSDADHPDRERIQPGHDEVAKRRAAGEPYVWKIDAALLKSRYPEESETPDAAGEEARTKSTAEDRIVVVLERSIAVLQAELEAKNKQIESFHERQREQNVLLKSLQERILIPEQSRNAELDGALVGNQAEGKEGTQRAVTTEASRRRPQFWNRGFDLFRRKHT